MEIIPSKLSSKYNSVILRVSGEITATNLEVNNGNDFMTKNTHTYIYVVATKLYDILQWIVVIYKGKVISHVREIRYSSWPNQE